MIRLAAFVMLVAVAHNDAWKLVPAASGPVVWNITGALSCVAYAVVIGLLARNRWVWGAVALQAGFSLQVAGCSAWWLYAPWPRVPGESMCSDGLGGPLGLLGLWVSLMLANALWRANGRTR